MISQFNFINSQQVTQSNINFLEFVKILVEILFNLDEGQNLPNFDDENLFIYHYINNKYLPNRYMLVSNYQMIRSNFDILQLNIQSEIYQQQQSFQALNLEVTALQNKIIQITHLQCFLIALIGIILALILTIPSNMSYKSKIERLLSIIGTQLVNVISQSISSEGVREGGREADPELVLLL